MGNPYEDFAAKVSTDIATNGLETAYKHFNSTMSVTLSRKTFVEKEEEWAKYARALESNGVLPRLGAEYLIENGAALDQGDGKADGIIHKSSLQNLAAVTKNPIFKELEKQALKQFDIAAALHQNDGTIDSRELASFKDRQSMGSREDFSQSLADRVFKALDKSPEDAAGQLQLYMGIRSAMETPAEKEETWKSVSAALEKRDPNILGKLSMSWLKNNLEFIDKHQQKDKAVAISFVDLAHFTNSPFPMTRAFARYVCKEFTQIASVDGYSDLDKISAREIQIYEEKMLNGK